MAIQKRRNRMYEPWGYVDENNYQGSQIILENDLDSFFAGVSYNEEDNKIHFTNKDGEDIGSLNVNDFVKSDQVIEKAWYEDGQIYIKFTNGDLVTIDVKELVDETEFSDGLQVEDGVVSVLKDPESEKWITISSDGVKISGVQAEIDRLDEKVDEETARAMAKEAELDEKIDQITSGTPIAKLDELIEKLGYKDNDTLVRSNEHEVAFGEWNISNTSADPAGQTMFSIGIGTSEDDRKNALEVMKDGSVYMWVEGDYMNVNKILAQIAHETYDTDNG